MNGNVLYEWEGVEYEHSPRSADWYWALGIVAIASVIAAILFGQYIVAAVIVTAALAIGLRAAKAPPRHRFRVVDRGLMIGEELHPFERISSFSMLEDIEGELPPQLSVKTESWLSPHLVIPLEGVDADGIYATFLARVDEEAHHHNMGDLVAAWLGF